MIMKYKVGDKVKVVKQQERLEGYQIPVGSVGKILDVDCGDENGLTYRVEITSFRGGFGISGDIWWFKEDNLELDSNEEQDVVNHPKHYTSDPSGIECIQVTRHRNFNIGNAMKYLWRNGLKDSDAQIQDLRKAIWYIEDEIKRLEQGSCTE
jgi:hypothetical protein